MVETGKGDMPYEHVPPLWTVQRHRRRVWQAAAAALVAGVTLCAAAPRFIGVAGDVAASLVR